MMFRLFNRRRGNEKILDRLYGALVEAARNPVFYRELGVPDTLEGRFDLLCLHACLVLRRLRALPPPADDLAQDLVDRLFAGFDGALRELGVGDLAVPKRMKVMASAFYGRAKAYDEALMGGESSLEAAVDRNVYGRAGAPTGAKDRLASYIRRSDSLLAAMLIDDFVAARLPFGIAARASIAETRS